MLLGQIELLERSLRHTGMEHWQNAGTCAVDSQGLQLANSDSHGARDRTRLW